MRSCDSWRERYQLHILETKNARSSLPQASLPLGIEALPVPGPYFRDGSPSGPKNQKSRVCVVVVVLRAPGPTVHLAILTTQRGNRFPHQISSLRIWVLVSSCVTLSLVLQPSCWFYTFTFFFNSHQSKSNSVAIQWHKMVIYLSFWSNSSQQK